MKPVSSLPLILIAFTACHSPSGSSHLLNDHNLYAADSVRMAVAGGDEKTAGKTLQAAMDRYKKGSDTAGSIALFKRSIIAYPTAKAYYELAGALLATRQYAEGIQALGLAENLGYKPLANVMFRYAFAYANIKDDSTTERSKAAVRYMELAIQMGYARPAQFLQKHRFPNMGGNYSFDATYNAVVAGGPGVDPERGLWDAYSTQFPAVPLPFTIDRNWTKNFGFNGDISFQYEKFIPEMREAKFSREGGNNYYFVAQLHKEAGFVVEVYAVRDETEDGSGPPLFMLASYDPHGRIIDKMAIAGQQDLKDNFTRFVMRPDLSFQLQDFKNIYKTDPDSAGYDSTNVSRQDPQPPVDYHLTAAGKFEKTGPALASR